ncbi:hypothetical protein EON66_11780, partial [archaeon]
YLESVKTMHETGGFGSIGYRYVWKREEAMKNLLRTHTTAISARMLYKLATVGCRALTLTACTRILDMKRVAPSLPLRAVQQPGGFKPVKYFSIDRVFRNESLDATHLAEFHQVRCCTTLRARARARCAVCGQSAAGYWRPRLSGTATRAAFFPTCPACVQVEGVVADYDLSLGDLIGVIAEFFRRIGITELRFKPAYNPYTEPSMEVFGYHPDLKKWTEIGNSGIFRPEMLRPMGLPENVRVIAWGLSLERPTMIKHRIKNIRDLFGHKVKFDMSRSAPIVRF